MQDFLLSLFVKFQESPSAVLKKALSLQYSYLDMFYIVFLHKKTCFDSFLEENLFMSEINTFSLSELLSELTKIQEDINAHESALFEDVFPS